MWKTKRTAAFGCAVLSAGMMLAGCARDPMLDRPAVSAGLLGPSPGFGASAAPSAGGAVPPRPVAHSIERPAMTPLAPFMPKAAFDLAARGLDHVYFSLGSARLTPEARDMLLGQVLWLQQHPQVGVRIEGHADEPGSSRQNIALGSSRAAVVREFLLARGIASRRLKRVVSYGRERPIERCSDRHCKPRNRRVQTVVVLPAVSQAN